MIISSANIHMGHFVIKEIDETEDRQDAWYFLWHTPEIGDAALSPQLLSSFKNPQPKSLLWNVWRWSWSHVSVSANKNSIQIQSENVSPLVKCNASYCAIFNQTKCQFFDVINEARKEHHVFLDYFQTSNFSYSYWSIDHDEDLDWSPSVFMSAEELFIGRKGSQLDYCWFAMPTSILLPIGGFNYLAIILHQIFKLL